MVASFFQMAQEPGFYLADRVGQGLWKAHNIKACSYEQFKAEALNYENTWKKTGLNNVTLEQVKKLATIFYFRNREFSSMRKQLLSWLKDYPQFYHDDIEVVYERMRQKLHEYQQQQLARYPLRQVCPFINWVPSYGGNVLPARQTQDQWHKTQSVPYLGEPSSDD